MADFSNRQFDKALIEHREAEGGREELSRLIHDHYIGFALLCFNLLHLQLLHDFSHPILLFKDFFRFFS